MLSRLLLLLSTLGITFWFGCDSTARIFLRLVYFDRLQIVSATPVKQETTSSGETVWVPACNGDATHVRLAVNLKSTQRPAKEGESEERDLQIRPGEDAVGKALVEIGKSIGPDHFGVEMDCIDPHDGTKAGGVCTGTKVASAVADLQWVDNLRGAGRRTPVGVAFVIDETGSLDGLVHGDQSGVSHTCIEGQEGTFWMGGTSIKYCASDSGNLRIVAVKSILDKLNDDDPVIAFAFNEIDGTPIVCNLEGYDSASLTDPIKAANCYTTNRARLVGDLDMDSALDGLADKGQGRSNMWAAVKKAWEYMATKSEVTKHIVVMADGPDTCDPGSDAFQHCLKNPTIEPNEQPQSPCANSVPFSDAKQVIVDALKQGRRDIQVSFLHFQSRAYPGHDPLMQEIACMTGGHYMFVNTNLLSQNSSLQSDALKEAASKLRYSMGGYWGLIVDVPDYDGDATASTTALDPGVGYTMRGLLKVEPSQVYDDNQIVEFAWGFPDKKVEGEGSVDSRLPILKPCLKDADCGAGAGTDECGVRCEPDAQVCAVPRSGTVCQMGTGICCGGACVVGGTNEPAGVKCMADKSCVCNHPQDATSCP